MRLIHAETLELEDLDDDKLPKYAILSHTWSEDNTQEVTFQDFLDPIIRNRKPGFNKIRQCCRLAQEQDLEYVWIDTCCINKESSAELQEAINSMYTWYQRSEVCYVFLEDRKAGLEGCRWFTRGWTLQELLAPSKVEFYDLFEESTRPIDPVAYTREHLADRLSAITGIEATYLKGTKPTTSASIAERMSWVSRRRTKKKEDMAYCLLGLFNVSLPLIYGEGWGAFRRLQEAIIAQSDDESIFAWRSTTNEPRGLVARYPSEFRHSARIRRNDFHRMLQHYAVTNRGVEFYTPARSVLGLVKRWIRQSTFNGVWHQVTRPYYLRLNCEDEQGRLIGIKLLPGAAEETLHRIDSDTWKTFRPESMVARLTVLYGGYERIYIRDPGDPAPTQRVRSTPLFSFDNLLLCTVVQSFSCMYLPAVIIHQRFCLEPLDRLNVFLGWAYLTIGWKALGENFYFWFGALTVGVLRPKPWSREMAIALLTPGALGGLIWSYTQARERVIGWRRSRLPSA